MVSDEIIIWNDFVFPRQRKISRCNYFYFLFTVTSKFGDKAIFLSFFKWRSKIFWKFPKIVKYGKATLWKDKEYSTRPSEQGRGVYVSIRRLS